MIEDTGTLAEHPFWGSQHTTLLPQDKRNIEETSRKAEEVVQWLIKGINVLAEYLHVSPPTKLSGVQFGSHIAQQMLKAPDLSGIRANAEEWHQSSNEIKATLQVGVRLHELHTQFDAYLIPEAWQQNVLATRKAYMAYGGKWWRNFSSDFRRAKRDLTGLCRSSLPKDVSTQAQLLDAILESQQLQPKLSTREALLSKLYNSHWQGLMSNWAYLAAVAEWLISMHQQIAKRPILSSVIDYLVANPDRRALQTVATSIEQALAAYQQCVTAVLASTKIEEQIRWRESGGLHKQTLIKQEALFHKWYIESGRVQEMVTFNQYARSLKTNGLAPVIDVSVTWPAAGHHLTDLVQQTWYEEIISQAFDVYPILNSFNAATHEQKIESFRQLDKYQLKLTRRELNLIHWNKLPRHEAGGQLGILRHEFQKKSRHKPVRQLIEQAGSAIQAIKPVFMMSPMSISTYLPPNKVHFDLVIFDEASQVKPVYAFGAIMRGKQTVVVGDNKQLPPTSFFDTLLNDEQPEESITADLESILRLFAAQGSTQRMLRWHYRSRHESLIAVSNYEFYDNKLVIFPSPDANNNHYGLVYHYLPQAYYDRGKSRSNLLEAKEVARAVINHARNHSNLTLGVAAFSTAQMEAILYQLEQMRSQDDSSKDFFRAYSHEPFFVKNLENVQGDERDVIFISIGYGHDANGHMTMNFGPLNTEGGERRLNVLITRARQRCEIFTNLKADDIDLQKTDARGVIALKRYLQYAETKRLDIPLPTGREADSPFEESVAAAIRELGYEVVHQVGAAGFFVDLAIIDPDRPGRYLLGVECDGATYHSARSARDRDRLRQEILEGLNWRIHRVWSTDWFQNPGQQIQKLATAIEASKLHRQSITKPELVHIPDTIRIDRHEIKESLPSPQTQPYKQISLRILNEPELHEVPPSQMATYVIQVVDAESPVHVEEVMRRIVDGAGIKRLGVRIETNIRDAIKYAIRKGYVVRQGDFLWKQGTKEVTYVRNRSTLPATSQKLALIAPEEIKLAIKTAVNKAFGLKEADIYSETCALFGFNRVTENRRDRLKKLVDEMIKEGVLICETSQYFYRDILG